MKKLASIMLVLLLALGVLVGCKVADPKPPATDPAPSSQKQCAVHFYIRGNIHSTLYTSENHTICKEAIPYVPVGKDEKMQGWLVRGKESEGVVDLDSYIVTGDVDLVAYITTVERYDITFHPNGGMGYMDNMELATDTSARLTRNTFTRPGYTFIGWATTPDGEVAYRDGASYTMGAESVTLYAVWRANANQVTFNANGGSGYMDNMELATDTSARLTRNTFTRPGYTFVGWATTPNGEVAYRDGASYTMGTESVTLYAVWQRSEYRIYYPGAENVQNPNPATITLSQLPYTLQDLVVDDEHIFVGWYTDPDFTQRVEILTVDSFGEDGVLNVYAQITLTQGLHYSLREDQTYMVTGYAGTDTEVTVPATYKDKPVSGIFNQAFSNAPSVQKVVLSDGIEWVDDYAFYNATNIREVVLPSTLDRIGEYAFYGCSSLSQLGLPQNLRIIGDWAFSGCNSLTSVSFPETLESVGMAAFYQCARLSSAHISSQLTALPDYVFSECGALSSVTFAQDSQLTSIGTFAFALTAISSIQLPAHLEQIGESAFSSCASLQNVDFPASLDSIGAQAFAYCVAMTSLDLPEGVTSVGDFAFWAMTGLRNAHMPDSIATFGTSIFGSCTSLESVNIPGSLKVLTLGTFSDCKALRTVTMNPDGALTEIQGFVFNGLNISSITFSNHIERIGESAFYGCNSLTDIRLPESLTSIGEYAFCQCVSLQSVYIPSGLTALPDHIFNECTSLSSVTFAPGSQLESMGISTFRKTAISSIDLPASVRSIGGYAFENCDSLESADLPESLESIGNHAFYNCDSLQSVYIPSKLTALPEHIFNECTSLSSVTFAPGSQLVSMGISVFRMTAITSIAIPDSVRSIAEYAFTECDLLASAHLPESLRSIGHHAFYNCDLLASVNIPRGLTVLPEHIFNECKSLREVSVPKDSQLERLEISTFRMTAITSIYLPSTMQVIGDYAFDECPDLERVDIAPGSQIESIGVYAFYQCKKLQSISLPASLTIIGEWAFGKCESLTAVNIATGSRLDRINNSAFYECKQLCTMTLPDSVTSIGEWAFGYCNLLDVRVPASLTSMGPAAYYQSGIQHIVIPSGMTIVPNAAFRYCKQVNTLEFAADSQLITIDAFAFDHIELGYYLSPEGLWTRNPDAKREVTIPDSVREIGAQAFLDACIDTININPTSQLEVLCSEAFTINSFTSIYLPATLKRIDAYAFTHDRDFKTIYYGGTMEQWKAIPKGLAWEVSDPVVICTDGEVQCR